MDTSNTSSISDRELGALVWINRNLGKAKWFDTLSCDITSDDGVNEFCRKSKESLETLQALGAESRAKGSASKYAEDQKLFKVSSNRTYWAYRRHSPAWFKIDATVDRGEEEELRRYTRGPSWSNNSCAVDCVITAAIFIDAWRTRIDVLRPDRIGQLTMPAILLRQLVLSPWGLKDQKIHDEFRNLLVKGLVAFDSQKFPQGRFLEVGTVMDACFTDLPQISWTECRVISCCDGREKIEGSEPSRCNNLWMMLSDPAAGYTLSNAISDRMCQMNNYVTTERCSSGTDCLLSRTIKTNVIMDRMPLRLMVHASTIDYHLTKSSAEKWAAFRTITVNCMFRGNQTKTVRYDPKCAVFLVNGNHFIVRMKLDKADKHGNEIGQFNGPKRTYVKGWWSDLNTESSNSLTPPASVQVIIYQQLSG